MKKNLKFETALQRLEEIVDSLEQGTLSLDDSLKQFEEGVQLTRFCSQKLSEAEKKVETLSLPDNPE
ncbi:MAG: exodeoxyribonuclease VII small subunit [bacterium]